MITACKPKIFLEINATNLKPYPYGAADIHRWLADHEYTLQTLSGEPADAAAIADSLNDNEDFVALPMGK